MIRFIDLRGDDTGGRFAFFTTVRNEFLTFNGSQTWQMKSDFIADFNAQGGEYKDSVRVSNIDRFIALIPDWADENEIEGEYDEFYKSSHAPKANGEPS